MPLIQIPTQKARSKGVPCFLLFQFLWISYSTIVYLPTWDRVREFYDFFQLFFHLSTPQMASAMPPTISPMIAPNIW